MKKLDESGNALLRPAALGMLYLGPVKVTFSEAQDQSVLESEGPFYDLKTSSPIIPTPGKISFVRTKTRSRLNAQNPFMTLNLVGDGMHLANECPFRNRRKKTSKDH